MQWLEETFTNVEKGTNNRAYVVCEVEREGADNWLRTPYIHRGPASRIFLNVTFSMRDCTRFKGSAVTCGETMTLLYHEADQPLHPGDPLPPWKETPKATDGYKKIDRISGDNGRFSSVDGPNASRQSEVQTVKTKSVGVSKGGLYFAFRDQGACTSILSVAVYYLVCHETTTQLARFPETPTAANLFDLVTANGSCVPHAAPTSQEGPKLRCKSDGSWDLPRGACRCLPGYETHIDSHGNADSCIRKHSYHSAYTLLHLTDSAFTCIIAQASGALDLALDTRRPD